MMKFELGPIDSMVMEFATEDWYGLYEMLFDITDSPQEHREARDRRALVEPALRRLLGMGLIEIGVRPYSSGVPVMTDQSQGFDLLAQDISWKHPTGQDSVVVFTATQLGNEVFAKGMPST